MYEKPDHTVSYRATVTTYLCKCWRYAKLRLFSDRTMNTTETLLCWETNLCHLDREPKVYQDIGEYVTGSLSDRLSQTCEPLFPPTMSFVASVMFVHRILPSRTPRLNVIGRYIDCSPITGLWMFAMGDSGILRSCTSYVGVNVGDFTTCRFLCDTDGLVSYVVLGISDRRALPTSDAAVICDIVVVWGPSPTLRIFEYLSFIMLSNSNMARLFFQNIPNSLPAKERNGVCFVLLSVWPAFYLRRSCATSKIEK